MPEPITNMESMEKGRSKSFRVIYIFMNTFNSPSIKAYVVALLNMEIRMYNDKQLVHTFKGEDIIAGMKYGVFGREDGALVILYNRLGLEVKILQRQFNMSVLFKFFIYKLTLSRLFHKHQHNFKIKITVL